MINYILKGNSMMRRHAEERHILIKQIIKLTDNIDEGNSVLVHKAIKEATIIQEEIDQLESHIIDDQDSQVYFKLRHLNKMMKILDRKGERRENLVDEVMQIDANLLARDELVAILSEYLDMESATVYRLVGELSETQSKIEQYNVQLNTYEKLSKHDPRFKALEILNKHPEGMSITQLGFMLGTSQYEAHKIIQILISLEMIVRNHNGELIHSHQNVETEREIEPIPENLVENLIENEI